MHKIETVIWKDKILRNWNRSLFCKMQIILIIPPFFSSWSSRKRSFTIAGLMSYFAVVPRNRERSGKSLLHRASLLLQCWVKSLISVLFRLLILFFVFHFIRKARAITSYYHTEVRLFIVSVSRNAIWCNTASHAVSIKHRDFSNKLTSLLGYNYYNNKHRISNTYTV